MNIKRRYKISFLLHFVVSSFIVPNVCCELIFNLNISEVSPSCTIFTVAIGDTVFFGNNEDYLLRDPYLWFIPSQNITVEGGGEKTIYGSAFVGFINTEEGGIYPQGGMNEHGLMYDFNGLPTLPINENPSGPSIYSDYILCASLWDCKNVKEVIEWFKNHKWDINLGGQIHYGDASGDAVIISANPTNAKWAFTRKNSSYLVSTNFNLYDPSNAHDYPCKRYDTAVQMLSEIASEEELTVQACADVLYAVHQEGYYRTLYSNIFDPVNLDLYLNYEESYSKQIKVNLLDALSQEDSFEEEDSFFGITATERPLLVNSESLDEGFYSSSSYSVLDLLAIAGLVIGVLGIVMVIPIVVYFLKKKMGVG